MQLILVCDDEERKKSSKVDAINLRWCQGEVSRKGGGREGGERAKRERRMGSRERERDPLMAFTSSAEVSIGRKVYVPLKRVMWRTLEEI